MASKSKNKNARALVERSQDENPGHSQVRKRRFDAVRANDVSQAFIKIGEACGNLPNTKDATSAIKMYLTHVGIPAIIGFPGETQQEMLLREHLVFRPGVEPTPTPVPPKVPELTGEQRRTATAASQGKPSVQKKEKSQGSKPTPVKTGSYWESDTECVSLATQLKAAREAAEKARKVLGKKGQLDPADPLQHAVVELTKRLALRKSQMFPDIHAENQRKTAEAVAAKQAKIANPPATGQGQDTVQGMDLGPEQQSEKTASHPQGSKQTKVWNAGLPVEWGEDYRNYCYAGYRRDAIVSPEGELKVLIRLKTKAGTKEFRVLDERKLNTMAARCKPMYDHFKKCHFAKAILSALPTEGIFSEEVGPSTFNESEFAPWDKVHDIHLQPKFD